jgi:hypothetical protein
MCKAMWVPSCAVVRSFDDQFEIRLFANRGAAQTMIEPLVESTP